MEDSTHTVGGAGNAGAFDLDSGHALASAVLGADPTLPQRMQQHLGVTPPPVKPPAAAGKMAPLWETVKAKAKQFYDWNRSGLQYGANLENAATRGVLSGVDQLASSAISGAKAAAVHTVSDPVFGYGKTKASFVQWLDNAKVPALFGQDRINRWFGPSQGGVPGFVEGLTQFGTGMVAANMVVPGSGFASTVAKGGLAGATAFDPHMQRLSNTLEKYPALSNPITRYLSAKDTDSDAEGRMKNALETMMVSSTAEVVAGGLKAAKFLRAGNAQAASDALAEAQVKAEAAKATEAVQIEQTPTGKYRVVPNQKSVFDAPPTLEQTQASYERVKAEMATATDPMHQAELQSRINMHEAQIRKLTGQPEPPIEGSEQVAPPAAKPADGPEFTNAADAQNFAQSVNYAVENEGRPRGSDIGADMLPKWKDAMKNYAENPDTRDVNQIVEDYGINTNYLQTPEEHVAAIKALVDVAPDASTVARGRVRTWAEVDKQASDMMEGMTGPEFIQRAHELWGNTTDADTVLRAFNLHLHTLGGEIVRLGRLADAMPDNPVAMDQLAAAWDSLHEFHAYFTGTKSNFARGLNILKMPVGEGLADASEHAAESTPAVDAAVAEATGEAPAGSADVTAENAGTEPDASGKPAKPKISAKPDYTGVVDGTNAPRGPSQLASNAGEQRTTSPDYNAPQDHGVTAGMTRAELRAMTRMAVLTEGDPNAMLKLLRGPRLVPPAEIAGDPQATKNWIDYALKYRMFAMLSGPKTLAVAAFNNVLSGLQRPVEMWLGGALTRNPALRQQGADVLGGMFSELGDSWKTARKAFLTGDSYVDPRNQMATGGLMNLSTDTPTGVLDTAKWLGSNMVEAPSRFHMANSEFFKTLNYRAQLRSQILRDIRTKGITDPEYIAQRLQDDMQFAFDPNGGAVNPLALEYARTGTFTNDLGEGTLGNTLQKAAAEHPTLRVIVPFIRVPTNIFRYAWERTPLLNLANKNVLADLKAGGDVAATRIGQTVMGTAFYTTAALLAKSGNLTGGGPVDPKLRSQWKEAGNQPYSIRIPGTDQWMSYRRMDPTMAPLGLAADIHEMSGGLHDADLTSATAAVIASVSANLTSKTYMQGVADFMDAVHSGDPHKAEHLLGATAGSFIPAIANQMNWDGTMRETRGVIDEMRSRIPGFSETLEPKRNIFGEKIMLPPNYANRALYPFTVMNQPKDGDVANELVKLGRALSMPAEVRMGHIDLTKRDLYDNGTKQSPYDRMLELMGQPGQGRQTLRSQVESMMQSSEYKNAPDEDITGPGGQKWEMVHSLLRNAQERAFSQMLKEYPKLNEAFRQQSVLERAADRGTYHSTLDSLKTSPGGLLLSKM